MGRARFSAAFQKYVKAVTRPTTGRIVPRWLLNPHRWHKGSPATGGSPVRLLEVETVNVRLWRYVFVD